MKRLIATVRCDMRLQFRNGFYYATAFLIGSWALLLSRLDLNQTGAALRWLWPVFVLDNLIVNSFFFIGGLVLLEKGERTIEAQVVTPLRSWEYLAAKVITLTLLALLQNLLIVGLFYGRGVALLPLVGGVTLASTLYALFGFIAAARYRSLNEYLLPSALTAAVLLAPVAPYATGWDSWLIYLHPLQAPLLILEAAFQAVPGWRIAVALLGGALWLALAGLLSLRAYGRFVRAGAGGM
jgi:fluoroquinolone transport system permease protein